MEAKKTAKNVSTKKPPTRKITAVKEPMTKSAIMEEMSEGTLKWLGPH